MVSGSINGLSFRDTTAAADRWKLSTLGVLTYQAGTSVILTMASATAGPATLNKQSGVITSEALSIAAGADYVLALTNSLVVATSPVFPSVDHGTTSTEGLAFSESRREPDRL